RRGIFRVLPRNALRQDMAVETRTIKADEAGLRLDRWFKANYPALAFGHLQKLLRTGPARVDGARAKTHTRLAPGQRVRVPPLEKSVKPGEKNESVQAPKVLKEKSERAIRDDAAFLKSITLFEDKE